MERIVIELEPELKKKFEVAVILDERNTPANPLSKKSVLVTMIEQYVKHQEQNRAPKKKAR